MIYLCLRFLREFEKWSELGKMGKNGVKWLCQNPHLYTTGRKFLKQIENTVGKGEIARYEQFLLSPECFQKTCTADTENQCLSGKG